MCLLINQPASTTFTREDIHDFFAHNPDGLGVMYVHDHRVITHKALPATANDAFDFYMRHAAGRDAAIHFRMRTHGDIDLINVHPYQIPGTDSYLMHNGVLRHGNAADASRSDTWHYANTMAQELKAAARPSGMIPLDFQRRTAQDIGAGNKFIIMSPRETVIINEESGVMHKGAWLSNTYAWSASYSPGTDYADDYIDYAAIDEFYDALNAAGLSTAYSTVNIEDLYNTLEQVGTNQFLFFVDMASLLTDQMVIRATVDPQYMTWLVNRYLAQGCKE